LTKTIFQSLGIGAVTTAAQKDLADYPIKLLGRWSSDAVHCYICSNLSLKQKTI